MGKNAKAQMQNRDRKFKQLQQQATQYRNLRNKAHLYDVLRSKDPRHIPIVPVIDVNGIEALLRDNFIHTDEWKDYSCIKPPYPQVFIEFGDMANVISRVSDEHITSPEDVIINVLRGKRYGALIFDVDVNEDTFETLIVPAIDDIVDDHDTRQAFQAVAKRLLLTPDANSIMWVLLYGETNETLEHIYTGIIPLNKSGAYTMEGVIGLKICIPRSQMNVLLNVAFYALQMTHCKNVELEDCDPDIELSYQFKKHSRVPMSKYKVLKIEAEKQYYRTGYNREYQAIMPLHLRRGNFATYTEDSPLFGKFTGTFWRPATVVGNAKNGVVVKDYKVSPE